jgi:hypothetical protein
MVRSAAEDRNVDIVVGVGRRPSWGGLRAP